MINFYEKIDKAISIIVASKEYQDFVKNRAIKNNEWQTNLQARLEKRSFDVKNRNTKLNIRRIKERKNKLNQAAG